MEPTADLEACLPAALRERSPTLTRIATGMSGAAVYRVVAGDATYVLRLAGPMIDPAAWGRQLAIERLAADAGVAPRVLHVDEARRAVVSAFVVDRSFPALFATPATREAALDLLVRTLRRLHALPVPEGAASRSIRDLLAFVWPELRSNRALPAFTDDIVRRVLDEPVPADDRAPVLSHNDPNPTNMAYDGADLLLLDWDTAGPNHPHYDLAVIALFLRMNDETCRRLLSSYEGASIADLPETFLYYRRISAAACGAMSLRLAGHSGHAGDSAATLESTPSLADVYQGFRTGALDLRTSAGQWQFGMALLKESSAL